MKVIFNCHTPFPLAHGGAQIQIEQTKAGLDQLGVSTDCLRWWDESQTGDILHQVGGIPASLVVQAKRRGWKVVNTMLLTETCNRSHRELVLRQLCVRTVLALPMSRATKLRLPWHAYHLCDRVVVGLEAERWIMEKIYGVPRAKLSVVPLGLSETYLGAGPAMRDEEHLIVTGTIGPSKNSLQLARLAAEARVPMLFVGKPFDLNGDYWREFRQIMDASDGAVRHHSHVSTEAELIALLRRARGYVLMSRFENWSLAAHEANACGLPMLLPDQRWARERFADQARYFPKAGQPAAAAALRRFYDDCPKLSPPNIRQYRWVEVAGLLRDIYQKVLDSKSSNA